MTTPDYDQTLNTPQRAPLTHAEVCSRGGKAGSGKAKSRTPKQARKAANTRWKKYRADVKAGLIVPRSTEKKGKSK